MSPELDLDAVADACIEANDVIQQSGTPEMLALIRPLLFVVGRELARRDRAAAAIEDRDDGQAT